jgi:predicted Rossmann fold flavoprotein
MRSREVLCLSKAEDFFYDPDTRPDQVRNAGSFRIPRFRLVFSPSFGIVSSMSPVQRQGGPFQKDVIILGAGASGLFCAMECGKRGRSVLVLDHSARAGSKVLVSGGGRCNFTNLYVSADHYLSANPHFCRSALARFTSQDMLALLKSHKIAYYEKEAGQLFCVRSSREIVALLGNECRSAGVELKLACRISGVSKEETFVIATDQGTFLSDSLVVATGGLSYPELGASGLGHALALQFGLKLTGLKPALVPFTFSAHDRKTFQELAGISLDASVICGGRRFRGSILFTHRGLSGPAVLQASSYWNKGDRISIDLLPDRDVAALFAVERGSRMELRTLLGQRFPRRFAETWCDLFVPSKPLVQYSDKELKSIEDLLHAWVVTPNGTEGYSRAEVTAGGVDTEGISSKTMEAKKVRGLYFIGEVLDVTGQLGGYNLHWAWASGHAAGQFA